MWWYISLCFFFFFNLLSDKSTDRRADITHSVMAVLRKDFIGFTRLPWGPKEAAVNPMAAELAQANRENARLKQRLAQAEAIIGIQKKGASLLGIPLATPDSDEEP